MKNLIIYNILCFFSISLMAQGTANMELVYQWKDSSITGSAAFNNAYNEIWGFVQNNHEFAVIGSTMGTHIFDITDTENVSQVAFIEGGATGAAIVHRDFHDYKGFLYAVCDESSQSTLQIIDISKLPNSFEVVYDSKELITRSHNIFIDTANAVLYSCGGYNYLGPVKLTAFSLENPTQPTLLANYSDAPWGRVHDAYVKDNIGYLNCTSNGLYIVDFTDFQDPKVLGVLENYAGGNYYNHSGWLSDDGKTYVMCDEVHGTPVHILDVSDPSDIQIKSTITSGGSATQSIVHNAMIRGNHVFLSYYYDGLVVFDLSNPEEPCTAGSYDTSQWPYDNDYRGNWGLYCYLPSGLVLASDMQEGLFVFKVVEAQTVDVECAIQPDWFETQTVPSSLSNINAFEAKVYPTVFNENMTIQSHQNLEFSIYTLLGEKIKAGFVENGEINGLNTLNVGMYILTLKANNGAVESLKIVKQ